MPRGNAAFTETDPASLRTRHYRGAYSTSVILKFLLPLYHTSSNLTSIDTEKAYAPFYDTLLWIKILDNRYKV